MTSKFNNCKFNIGDHVWHTIAHTQHQVVGWDDTGIIFLDHGIRAYSHNLVLAPTWIPSIVAKIVNGKVWPARDPVVHADVGIAVTEAQFLALINPGVEFGTFVLKNISCAPIPVVTTRSAS